jgi:hypothetical protein
MARHIQELIVLLPYDVQDKLRRYLDFAHDRLIDIALEEHLYDRVATIRDDVDLVFLLRLLYGYFVVGFQNYDQMLHFFESKQVRGFQIGSTRFTRDNSLTYEWRQIASELESLIRQSNLGMYVRPTFSSDEVLRSILRATQDGTETKS